MSLQLPEQADPWRLCEQGKCYEGRVALQDLARLTSLLNFTGGEAAFTLAFDRDETRRPRVRGRVCAELQLCCQRCLQSMPLAVDLVFQLSPVTGLEEAERLPEEYEPLMLDEHLLHPMDLVEDELILAIPPAPRHTAADCGVDLTDYRQESAPEAAQQKENPFAPLRVLKHDNDG